MATAMRQPSPPNGIHPHHAPPQPLPQALPPPPPPPPAPPGAHPPMHGYGPMPPQRVTPQHLSQLNEAVWMSIGSVSELMNDLDGAIFAFEQALRHNAYCIPAMNQISAIHRTKENFGKAVEYLQAILKIEPNNGEVWGSLGHCFLMMDNLQEAYSAYQQALYHLRDPKEPKLWYGIGILYDRYGSLEHAEEAFSQVMRMEPGFEKANEIYFRLGIIYKQQGKFGQSLECFKYIIADPPRPLTEEDIWFQIGHVYEQQKDFDAAKGAYRRVLDREPNHAKVLQQLGWLHHQHSGSYNIQEQAIEYLEKSVANDNTDAQTWYLLGRCYMSQTKYSKAYEAYQQAVYRDGRNPTFWCSIGVLYYQINQYRDALDAYSRAIRLNPYISEVWFDLGTLYESCNNQTNDALDAYQRAADLDPNNMHIKGRLQILRSGQGGAAGLHPPAPQDVHPQHYQNGVAGPPGPQWGAPAPGPSLANHGPLPGGPPGPPPADFGRRPPGAVDGPQPPPMHQYDQRDGGRPPPGAPRPHSPRGDPLRFGEQHRGTPRGRPASPPPPMHHGGPGYPGPPLPQPPHMQQSAGPPNRITNPNYGAPPSAGLATPPAGGPMGGPMPPPGRGLSPPPEIKPLADDRSGSPHGTNLPQMHQARGPPSGGYPTPTNSLMTGPPPSAFAAAEAAAAARDRDDRPPTGGFKRMPEGDEDTKMPSKRHANGDVRGRLDDMHYRRGSPTQRPASSASRSIHARRSSSEMRREHGGPNFHSEGPSHPPSLPAMQHGGPPSADSGTPGTGPPSAGAPPHSAGNLPPQSADSGRGAPAPGAGDGGRSTAASAPSDEPAASASAGLSRREAGNEGPARKVEVDEDYDDAGDDESRKGGPGSVSGAGPGSVASASSAAAARDEPPRSMANGQLKAEAAA